MRTGSKGAVETVLIIFLAGVFGGTVLGSWKPLAMFRKAPPTAQLTELQAKLDAQQSAAVQAAKDAEAVKIAERAKLEAQVRAAQRDNVGTIAALSKVPASGQTPEVKLASRMAQRVSLKLTAAIGALPRDQQDAMIELIDQALSDKQAEVDEANRKLAALDEQFKLVSKEREAFKEQIPVLQKRADDMAKKASETQAAVTAKTQEVKTWAEKADKALREQGSLWESVKSAVYWLVGGYLFLAFGLPAIVKVMSSGNPLKPVLRNVSGYLLNPILHHDAAVKLNARPPTEV